VCFHGHNIGGTLRIQKQELCPPMNQEALAAQEQVDQTPRQSHPRQFVKKHGHAMLPKTT